MVYYMVLLIIIPMKNGYFIKHGYFIGNMNPMGILIGGHNVEYMLFKIFTSV